MTAPSAAPRRRSSRSARSLLGADPIAGVAVIAAGAAVAALFCDAAPTGLRWWDAALCALFAAAFTVAVSTGPRLMAMVAAVVGAAFVGVSAWLAVAAVGVVAAFYGATLRRRDRVVSAIAGACAVQAMLRWPAFGFFGLPSLIVAAVALAAAAVGFGYARRRTRRSLVVAGVVVAVAVTLLGAVGSLLVLSVRTDAEQGVAAARRGLSAARAGDTERLTAELSVADQRLSAADATINGRIATVLRLIPVVAQNHRAAGVAVREGALLARQATQTAADADLATLQLRQGSFDLAQIEAMAPSLDAAALQLGSTQKALADVRSEWLLGALDSRLDDLADEIDALRPEAELSAQAARTVPGLLGKDGARRYLVLFGSPGESREMGGFTAAYALLDVDNGSLSVLASGRSPSLRNNSPVRFADPLAYPVDYVRADPFAFPQNLTNSPSLGVVRNAVQEIYPLIQGAPVDGIVYLDPVALAALLEFTGPIALEGVAAPLTASTLTDFLFREQYIVFADRAEGFEAYGEVVASVSRRLSELTLPGPEELGRILGPSARAGRLQMIVDDPAENDFLQRIRMQRVFRAPARGDALAVVQATSTISKLDLYLEREITYDAQVDESGNLDAALRVVLRSSLPADAPAYTLANRDPDPRQNRVLLSFYTPHSVESLTVDGVGHEFFTRDEFGFRRHALVEIPVPAMGETVVEMKLRGSVDLPYEIGVWHQPLVRSDLVTIDVETPQGSVTETIELVEDVRFGVPS